ncbi:hypothetical protein N9B63_06970 [Akkermansiaceae bacterium]|nr:hypothetical protein [Akkermansiaceae bacterium]
MKISYKTVSAKVTKTDLLVVLLPEGRKPKLPGGVSIPKSVAASFSGKSRETRFADAIDGPAERALLIGLGEGTSFDLETVRRAAAIAAHKAEKTDPSDKLRQDLHLVELERRRKNIPAAIAILKQVKTAYKDIPEVRAIDGLLTILDPPAPPPTKPKK